MKLRDYQIKAINAIRLHFAAGKKRVLLQLPTGGGKTVIFTHMAFEATKKGNSVLVITDRTELLDQANRTFKLVGVHPQLLTAKTKQLEFGQMYIAMSETIKRRLIKLEYMMFLRQFGMIIIDEVHKQSFDRIYEYLGPEQYVIGVTATPYRFGKMTPLKNFYDEIVIGEQITDLIATGFLTKASHWGIPIEGLNKVKITAGEFDAREMGQIYNRPQLYSGVIENLRRIAPSGKALLFAATVENSKLITSELNQAGFTAMHLDADTPKDERKKILDSFAAGEFQVLCNVGILTTGYDEATIETIILYRATRSLPLFLQMCGRGSRIAPGKSQFNILDFGENVQRFGYWDDPRKWSLDLAKLPKKIGAELIKSCPKCNALIKANASECIECGYKFPVKKKKQDNPILVHLKNLRPSEIDAMQLGILELEQIRMAKGYKVGWVLNRLKSESELREYARLKNYKPGWVFYQLKFRSYD